MRKKRKVQDSGSILPTNNTVTDSLNKALASELVSYWMYKKAIGFLSGPYAKETENLLSRVADEELIDHAESLLKRMKELSVSPVIELDNAESITPAIVLRPGLSVKSYLVASALSERFAVEIYAGMQAEAEEIGDITTKNIFEHLLSDEESHSTEFCHLLDSAFVDQEKSFFTLPVYPLLVCLTKFEEKVQIIGYFNRSDYHSFVETPLMVKGDLEALQAQLITDYEVPTTPAELLNCCSECGTHQVEPGVSIISSGDECSVTCDNDSIVCDSRDINTIIDHILKHRKEDKMNLKAIRDDLQDREVNGQVLKTKQFKTAEEANKFLETNKGYTLVDQDDQGVYVTLESQVKNK